MIKKSTFAVSLFLFLLASCEKHPWNDQTKEITETIRDDDGKVVEEIKTPVVDVKGAKRFFIEPGHSVHDESNKKEHGKSDH